MNSGHESDRNAILLRPWIHSILTTALPFFITLLALQLLTKDIVVAGLLSLPISLAIGLAVHYLLMWLNAR